jgi:SAM-dependent methyltransferase
VINKIISAMDYDKSNIAATYNEARELTPARQRRWRDLLAAHVDRSTISLVVDLGCGTGRFSEILAAEFGARIVGFDPSEKMIEQARLKPATGMIEFKRASAEELPLADGCVDLVFMSQVYHHLPDPVAVAQECGRILRTGGYVCVRTTTCENDVVIRHFFPAVRAMLDADLPSGEDVSSNFVAAGFVAEHHAIITEIVTPDWREFIRKSALRADSFLARLSDSEFNRGMAALRAHVDEINPNEAVTEEIDWFVFTKHA